MTPEIKLWRSVIIQTLLDALSLFPEPAYSNRRHTQTAKEWLVGNDINLVCDYADLTPNYIRHLYKRLKPQKHLKMHETEDLLKNVLIRPDKPTVYH